MSKIQETVPKFSIGIPRALLYYRYKTLWTEFFKNLGLEVVLSDVTTKEVLEMGNNISIDEMCLSTKLFMGHVKSLIGNCDYIFVPRISNYGITRYMCVKFEALYDMTCNVFREEKQKFVSCNINGKHKRPEDMALVEMAMELGFSKKVAQKAYKEAKEAEKDEKKALLKKQEQSLKSDKIKILMVAHSYVLEDDYIGRPITEYLDKMDCEMIRADVVNQKEALKITEELSPTLSWDISRDLLGGVDIYQDKVDGIILLSAFPCNPDSMVNEMIIRNYKEKPILNMTIDAQSGVAGLETRLESFIDIINFKEGRL